MILTLMTMVPMMSSSVKIAQVVFAGNYVATYDFFTDLDKLQVGDPVVCDTARGYRVGKVIALKETSDKATNWIVQQVDVKGHKERMKERRAGELAEMLE